VLLQKVRLIEHRTTIKSQASYIIRKLYNYLEEEYFKSNETRCLLATSSG